MTEIEGVLNKLGRCALARIPAMVKLSLKELAEIPWVAAELKKKRTRGKMMRRSLKRKIWSML